MKVVWQDGVWWEGVSVEEWADTFHQDTGSCVESSISNRSRHNPQNRSRQLLAVVGSSLAPHTSSLMLFTGSTGNIVHLHGLTVQQKAFAQANLAIYSQMLDVSRQCQRVTLMLSYKLYFNSCGTPEPLWLLLWLIA